ncbi:DUF4097 family beta strand repeat-containing protein [Streptomyces sp. NPDC048057]|uniref:DUF4097 family beta strand repeat-containing protein n=1 Tax=Streptomyces sp. NPDC048057 TaxID=3155628 RepID=UPI0033FEE828
MNVHTARSVLARRPARVVVGVVLGGGLLLGATGCGGSTDVAGAPMERAAFGMEGKVLTVDAGDTDVEIVPADVTDVRVSRQVDGWAVFGSGPDASWRMERDRLTLRVDCDGLGDCASRHTVQVPRDVAVTVEHDNGSLTARDFTTALTISTDNGDVTVRDTTGDLNLDSDNGTIVAERITAGKVRAETDNGKVRIGFKEGAGPGRVEAVSDNGDIVLELARDGAPYAVTAKAGNGKRRVDVPTDDDSPRVVKALNDNGNVTVRLAR